MYTIVNGQCTAAFVSYSTFLMLCMWSFIQQLLIYVCYLSILYAVSYVNRNPHSYQQVKHLRIIFLIQPTTI